MLTRSIKSQKGAFNMIEVLVTTLLLSIALVATMQLQAYSMVFSQNTADYHFATQAVDSVIDEIRADLHSNPSDSTNYGKYVEQNITEIKVIDNKPWFTVMVQWENRGKVRSITQSFRK